MVVPEVVVDASVADSLFLFDSPQEVIKTESAKVERLSKNDFFMLWFLAIYV